MSISGQRNSLRKTSTSIGRIQKSISGLREGLITIRKNATDILEERRKTNLLKRNLIKKDNEFFAKRRENVLRKQREDELESTSVTGVTKKQGNLFAQSTRGFFGRILDFLGVLLVGWALQNLPKFIAAFQKLFGMIKKVVEIMSGFIKTITGFLTGIATSIGNLLLVFSRVDFSDQSKQISEKFQQGSNLFQSLQKQFVDGINDLLGDKDISDAVDTGFSVDSDDTGGGNDNNNDNKEQGGFFKGIKNLFGIGKKDKEELTFDDMTLIPDRDMGGDVVKGEPYLIGLNPNTGEPDERTETFIPTKDGVIANNQETDELIKGQQNVPDDETLETENDEMNEDEQKVLDFLKSGDDTSSKGSGATGVSGGGEDTFQIDNEIKMDKKSLEEKNKKSKKDKKDVAENIKPSKRQVKNLKGVKKSKTRTVVIEKPVPMGGGGRVQPMVNSGNTVVQNRQSDISTLLKLQSGSTLKYT